MKGNIYISVPAADKAQQLPASLDRYDWETFTYNEDGDCKLYDYHTSYVGAVR